MATLVALHLARIKWDSVFFCIKEPKPGNSAPNVISKVPSEKTLPCATLLLLQLLHSTFAQESPVLFCKAAASWLLPALLGCYSFQGTGLSILSCQTSWFSHQLTSPNFWWGLSNRTPALWFLNHSLILISSVKLLKAHTNVSFML